MISSILTFLFELYRIDVVRITSDQGQLTFKTLGKVVFTTDCWWDPAVRIPAKTYFGCSTTIMASKKFRSVYLPDEQTGHKGIFIHPGANPKHSDGCIVIAGSKVNKIYETVPTNGRNVTVVVTDGPVTPVALIAPLIGP